MALNLKKMRSRRVLKKMSAIRARNAPKSVKSLGKILPKNPAPQRASTSDPKVSFVEGISGKSKKLFNQLGKKIPSVKREDLKGLFRRAKSKPRSQPTQGVPLSNRQEKLRAITSQTMGSGGEAALRAIVGRARRSRKPMIFNYYTPQGGEGGGGKEVVREIIREQAPPPQVIQPQIVQVPMAQPVIVQGGGGGGGSSASSEDMFKLEKAAVRAANMLEKTIASGIVLPEVQAIKEKLISITSLPLEWSEQSKKEIYEHYNLIPSHPKPGEQVFASATIAFSAEDQALVYSLNEPPMNPHEIDVLKKIEEKMQEKLDVDFDTLALVSQKDYLRNQVADVIDLFGYSVTDQQRAKIEYYIFRDFIGLNKIEPIMHDPNIEDVSCDGIGIPVYIFHRNPVYGQLKTNVVFLSKEDLDSFVMKMSQKCGKSISVATPLLDGSLPDGSRVQATLGSDIARRGSNFTIRKFTENPLTPVDLMRFGTLDSMSLAYLWLCIEYGKSVLIAGTTACGKTTLLNAISLFIRPEMKIVSIEDTGELQLPHPNWIPETARSGMGEKSYGAVEMYDLLKAALRQRPDYVIVGEVRGKEAAVMFQGMATGHPSMGTIHADSVQRVVDRLVTPPISLSPALLENLDIIVFLVRTKVQGQFQRRALKITEVRGVDIKNERIVPNDVFQWDPIQDKSFPMNPSLILAKLAAFKGTTEESVKAELERRAMLLEFLARMNISSYEAFAYYINQYYANPDALFKQMRG